MAGVRNFWFDIALFVLASPVLFVLAARRGIHRYRFFRLAMESAIVCECGSTASLVGLWRCGWRFTYLGQLPRLLPVSVSLPSILRCSRFWVTNEVTQVA